MPDIDPIRPEIEREPKLVDRRRRDILTLKRAGRSSMDAELILVRQLARLDDPIRAQAIEGCTSRTSARQSAWGPPAVRHFATDPNVTPFLRALDTLRREASRQVEYPEHAATIIAMIDQYAESALGDRHYFCDGGTS